MNPYEEIRRLQEENARLREQLNAIEQRKQEAEVRQRWEESLPSGSFHMQRCYEAFQNIMENYGLPVIGNGESYKIICDNGQVYYFMRGRAPGSNINFLMIQIGNGLIYKAKDMKIYSPGEILINYGSGKRINLTLDINTLIIGDADVISIQRINRTVRMDEDETIPASWTRNGYDDSEYNYSLEGNADIIDIQQHRKRWIDQDGNIRME